MNENMTEQAAKGSLTGKQEEEQKQEKRKILKGQKSAAPIEAVKNAELISWFLFLSDLAAGAVLTLLHFCLFVMTGLQYYLVMVLLPLNYMAYIWVFADLIGEGRWENDKWMKGYLSVEMRWGILILQNLLSVLQGLMVSMQCVRGEERIFWTGFVIFLILSMITVLRFGFRRSRMRVILLIVIMTGALCLSMTPTLFLAAAGPQRHRIVEVTRVTQNGGIFGSWYAFIRQENGRETRLLVDSFTYRRLERGGKALLHKYNSLFDTEFVYLWANPPE